MVKNICKYIKVIHDFMWLWLKYLEITIPSERIRYTVFNLKLYGKTHTFFIPLPPKENNRHGTIQ